MVEDRSADHELHGPGVLESVPSHLWEYAVDQGLVTAAAAELETYLGELGRVWNIPVHYISARSKSLTSYRAKADREKPSGGPKYSAPRAQIMDCVAARVITFTDDARADFEKAIGASLQVVETQNPGHEKRNGYDSLHLLATGWRAEGPAARYPNLAKFFATYPGLEIQLRSVAAHAWAEYEHDVRYKRVNPGTENAYEKLGAPERKHVDQLFVEAGGLRRFMDSIFDEIQRIIFPREESEIDVTEGSDDVPIAPSAGTPGSAPNFESAVRGLAEMAVARYPDAEAPDKDELGRMAVRLNRLLDAEGKEGSFDIRRVEKLLEGSDARPAMSEYVSPPTASRMLEDELLGELQDSYIHSASGPDSRMLSHRLNFLNGARMVYSVVLPDGTERGPFGAATALRVLVRELANAFTPEDLVVDNLISLTEGEISAGYKPVDVEFNGGHIFVARNLNRATSEDLMKRIARAVGAADFHVLRGGDRLL